MWLSLEVIHFDTEPYNSKLKRVRGASSSESRQYAPQQVSGEIIMFASLQGGCSPIVKACFRTTYLFVLSVVLIGMCRSIYAQSTQGTILGVVRDQQGALISGATVTLANVGEGVTRTATSNADGDYQFVDAKAGHYTVEVTRDGFEKWQSDPVLLEVRQQLRLDVNLTVGSVKQEVEVSPEDSSMDTETPAISAVYSQEDAQNLPVNTRASASGTSALNIIGTLPGVQSDPGGFSLQGGLPFQTEVSVDGITIQSATSNSPLSNAFPSTESISELRVDGAQNNAEFGQPGQVTVTTKGGTNMVHGSAFWYNQIAAFDAIPYTYITTTSKPKLISNTFGGSLSGPVVISHLYNGHDKTFFFGAYEGWRHPSQTTNFYKVPSALMKQGNFTNYNSNVYSGALVNPFTGGSYGSTIPTASLNASSLKLLSFYPNPNAGDPAAYTDDSTPNYQINQDTSAHSDQFDIRADQYLGSNQKFLMWGRYTWKDFSNNSPEPLLVPSSQNINQSRVLKLSANYTIKPSLINEAGFGYTLYETGTTDSFNGTSFTNGLGLQGLQNLFYNGLPELDFNNISSLNADRLNSVSDSDTFVYTDVLTWTKGKHVMRFGFDIRTLEAVTPLGFFGADNYGTFQFNTDGSTGIFTGVDFADFLLGLPNQTEYDVVQQDNDGKSIFYDLYAQDQWQVSNKLTLSYGLRYELHPGYYDPNGDIGNFDPSVAKSGAVIYPDGKQSLLSTAFLASANACAPYGSGGVVNGAPCMPVETNSQAGFPSGLKHYPHLRFLPRFGVAYTPSSNQKTVIRAGFGVYYDTELGSSFYSLTGTLQSATTSYTNTYNPATHAIGYQWPLIYAGAGASSAVASYGQDYFGTANSTNWKDPYTYQFSLSVDRDLGSNYVARVSYIGSLTRDLVWAPDENTLPFSNTISANDQPSSARLFPNWGRINTRDTGANSSYNSLQVEIDHRFTHGLQFDSTYTFAKALANNEGPTATSFAGEVGGSRSTSILDINADFGNVFGTRRQRWNSTMVYDLPFGRGRKFGGTMPRYADLLVGGWRLSNILLVETGPFESPYYDSGQGDPSGTGSGLNGATNFDGGHRNQHPDRIPGVNVVPLNRTRRHYLNPAAFGCPGNAAWTPGTPCTTGSGSGPVPNPIGRFGNAQVGSVVGPGTVVLSSGLNKTFFLTERFKFRIEGTFTNILNNTNLGNPIMDVSSPSFGEIPNAIGTDNGGARSGQVSARLDF